MKLLVALSVKVELQKHLNNEWKSFLKGIPIIQMKNEEKDGQMLMDILMKKMFAKQ